MKNHFLITDIESTVLTDIEKKWITHPCLYGILLFSRNFKDIMQLSLMIKTIKKNNPKLKIFVDYEGGRVQRFTKGFTKIKPMNHLGKSFNQKAKKAKKRAKKIGKTIGRELVAVGVDVNFAPVVDCDYQKDSGAIGDRAFHQNPKVVFELAKRIIEGFQQKGLEATIKHFPGHGFVNQDTHFHFVRDERSFEELTEEMQIYFWLSDYFKTKLRYMMLSHLVYSCFDDLPVFLSKKWIRYIREVIDYKGKIISDDLNMKAAKHFGNILDLTQKSLEAGCDLVIICNNQSAREEVFTHFA